MRLEYIFYSVGVIFGIATVLYFTWEYLFQLGRSLKVAVLVLLALFFFFMANYLKGRDI
ncbi:hypothetical protein KY329_03485 [Candidatus Woesearchaeota archaeon]|nr:hypothetical protein [Candidatus Woesearchaeota archaeon]